MAECPIERCRREIAERERLLLSGEIPEEMEGLLQGLQDWSAELRIIMNSAHFTDTELACHHCGVNACTQELVDALEALRVSVGVPIQLDDAYRCPVHNAAVGGVPHSQHELGMAADIKIQGMTPPRMYQAALRIPAFANGGIGVAEHGGYIHVDVRAVKARWCYGANGQQCAWDTVLDAVE